MTMELERLELEDVPALLVQQIKDWQAHCAPHTNMNDVMRMLGITCKVFTQNLAVPTRNLVMLTPDNFGKDNHVVRHEVNHIVLHWTGLDKWLDLYAPDSDKVNEWICNNTTVFWEVPQPYVDHAVYEHGVTADAVLYLEQQLGCEREDALKRLVQDCPYTPRAGFIVKHGRVANVQVNGMWLPFWLHDAVEPTTIENLFPDELKLSITSPQRGHYLGVVSA